MKTCRKCQLKLEFTAVFATIILLVGCQSQTESGNTAKATGYEPDGRIILSDEQDDTVFLDIGTDDHVCLGLTFLVYDRNVPISIDAKAKASIEVFSVERKFSKARVMRKEISKSVEVGDVVVKQANSIEGSKYAQTRESDLQQVSSNNTIEFFADLLRKNYTLEKRHDGMYVCRNSSLVDQGIAGLLRAIADGDYSNEDDTIPMKFCRALEDEGAKMAQHPRLSVRNAQMTIKPERFGGNPAHMTTGPPLPQAQISFRELHVHLFFDQNGLCYKKEASYSPGSLIMLQNGNIYVYDGEKWCGPY